MKTRGAGKLIPAGLVQRALHSLSTQPLLNRSLGRAHGRAKLVLRNVLVLATFDAFEQAPGGVRAANSVPGA